MSAWWKNGLALAAVTTGLATAAPAFAASDIFIKIGDIKGESLDSKHKGEIEVLSWSWGVSSATHQNATGGAGAGKTTVHELTLTKHVDAASPKLLQAALTGQHIANVTLVVRRAGERPVDYVKIELTDVVISSLTMAGAAGGDRANESLALSFAKVKFSYTPQGPEGQPGDANWNLKENRAQ